MSRERGFSFRPPTEADMDALAAGMRLADRREVRRWTGQDLAFEVRHSVETSDVCHAAFFGDGALACLFGACRANALEGEAVIWALTTEAVDRHRMEFWAGSKAGLDLLFREMPDVSAFSNYVDAEYAASLNWLWRLGATPALAPRRRGFRGGEFVPFYFINPHCSEV